MKIYGKDRDALVYLCVLAGIVLFFVCAAISPPLAILVALSIGGLLIADLIIYAVCSAFGIKRENDQ